MHPIKTHEDVAVANMTDSLEVVDLHHSESGAEVLTRTPAAVTIR